MSKALTRDLGLSECTKTYIQSIYQGPIRIQPLDDIDNISGPDDVGLSTGGAVCILAYWIFSSAVFKADQPQPDMHIFPDHFSILQTFLEDDAQSQVVSTPGTVAAVVAIGLWLEHKTSLADAEASANFMSYHHLLTLCGIYHPDLPVRNAAISLAGSVLHGDPDEDDRLKILEDLLENCMFASLKACAVTWLREEIMAAPAGSRFSTTEAIEQLQYAVFPDLLSLKEMDHDAFLEYWVQNSPFLLQAANFAYLLFCGDKYTAVVPPAMGPAIEQRYAEPLVNAASAFLSSSGNAEEGMEHVVLDLSILVDRLKSLKLS